MTTETEGTDFTSAGCTDVAGWASEPATATVRIDMTRPVVAPDPTPPPNAAGWHRDGVTVGWTCEDAGTVRSGIAEDTLEAIGVGVQTSGRTPTSVGTCLDRADNEAAAADYLLKLDLVSPAASLTGGPVGATAATDATFTAGATDVLSGLAGIECRLDSGAWEPCAGEVTFDGLADGTHSATVRGTDVAGNVSAFPALRLWTVDTIAPQTSLSGGPDSASDPAGRGVRVLRERARRHAIVRYECRLDGGDWQQCGPYAGLADGAHTAEARAVDAAGNADATPASRTWVVDTAAPETSIDVGASVRATRHAATFAYAGDALGGSAIAGHECKLDDGEWAECEATYADLPDGGHRMDVRAYDAAGNRDATPASATWTLDTAGPQTWIIENPPPFTRAHEASFAYLSDALGGTAVTGYECRLDDGAWAACADTYTELVDGERTLRARAVDAAGNADETPAEYRWWIDSISPDTTLSGGPDEVTASRTAAFGVASDALGGLPVVLVQCRLDAGAWGSCPPAYAELSAGEHTFEARSTDAWATSTRRPPRGPGPST